MPPIKKTTTLRHGDTLILVNELPETFQRAVEQYDGAREETRDAFISLAMADNALESMAAKLQSAIQHFEVSQQQEQPEEQDSPAAEE